MSRAARVVRPRLRVPPEWREQEALVRWAALHEAQEPRFRVLFAVPNGEWRAKSTAGKLVKMGVRAGVPDLCLPIPARFSHTDHDGTTRWVGFHALWLEMKPVDHGVMSEAQQAFGHLLLDYGHYVALCHGWVEGAKTLCWYVHRDDLAKEL